MNMDEKADIFKSQIEQVVGEKLDNLVFLATYKEEGHDKAIVSTNGELMGQAQLLLNLFEKSPLLMAVMAAYFDTLREDY